MGLQLSRLERTPDKREVGGSSPLKPITKRDQYDLSFFYAIEISNRNYIKKVLPLESDNTFFYFIYLLLKTKEGLQLSRLERTPDKREVGGSSPLKPTFL